jgi:hypothetical protein
MKIGYVEKTSRRQTGNGDINGIWQINSASIEEKKQRGNVKSLRGNVKSLRGNVNLLNKRVFGNWKLKTVGQLKKRAS